MPLAQRAVAELIDYLLRRLVYTGGFGHNVSLMLA